MNVGKLAGFEHVEVFELPHSGPEVIKIQHRMDVWMCRLADQLE